MWVLGSFPYALGPVDFADRACSAPFRLATPIPLPKDLSGALDYVVACDDAAINSFRGRQLMRLEALAAQ